MEWPEYVWYWFGWLVGAVYWAFYRADTVYVAIWAFWYLLCSVAFLVFSVVRNIKKNYIYLMAINIILTVIYLCVILFLTISAYVAGLVTAILFMLGVGSVPIAYNYIENRIPKVVKIVCGGIIVAGVVGIAVVGVVFQVASHFAIFSFVMGAVYIVLFSTATIIYLTH